MPTLVSFHSEMQYAVLAALVAGVLLALWWGRQDRMYRRLPFTLVMVVVDLQVLVGIILWVEGAGWQLGITQGVLHPLLALAALGVGHAALKRARETIEATAAYRLAAIGLSVATALVVLAVIAATLA